MIQITIHEDEPISQFIEARASKSGQTTTEIAEEVVREGFFSLVRVLHEQFMRGEISQGRMAELLGISRADLIHLLERMELPVTNL